MSCQRTRDMLLAHTHGGLSEAEAGLVRDHLARCEACTEAERRLIQTEAQLGALAHQDAPPELFSALQAKVEERARRRPVRWAAALVLGLLSAGLVQLWRPAVHFQLIEASVPQAEQARRLHAQRLSGALELKLKTRDVSTLKAWCKKNCGVQLELSAVQPPATAKRISLVGATPLKGGSGVFIALEIDEAPVSLWVSAQADSQIPEGHFSKNIFYRRDAESHALIWSRDARGYVLISDGPSDGRMGCYSCHVGAERRRLIQNMKLSS